MWNATVREYTRRCNTVENIHIHKVIGLCDRVVFVRETKAINIRKVPLVPSTKQLIVFIFIFLWFFCFPLFQPCSIRCFSLFDTFSHLRNLKNVFSIVTVPQGQQHRSGANILLTPCYCKSPPWLWATVWEYFPVALQGEHWPSREHYHSQIRVETLDLMSMLAISVNNLSVL